MTLAQIELHQEQHQIEINKTLQMADMFNKA